MRDFGYGRDEAKTAAREIPRGELVEAGRVS